MEKLRECERKLSDQSLWNQKHVSLELLVRAASVKELHCFGAEGRSVRGLIDSGRYSSVVHGRGPCYREGGSGGRKALAQLLNNIVQNGIQLMFTYSFFHDAETRRQV